MLVDLIQKQDVIPRAIYKCYIMKFHIEICRFIKPKKIENPKISADVVLGMNIFFFYQTYSPRFSRSDDFIFVL